MVSKIPKLRAKIAEIKAKIAEVESGSFRIPLAQAIAKLDEHLALNEAEGLSRINHFLSGFAYANASSRDPLINIHPHDLSGPGKVLAALVPGAMRARLVELLELQYADESDVFDPNNRAAWLKSKRDELLKLELEDFRETAAAKEPQRPDLDARVLLGIA